MGSSGLVVRDIVGDPLLRCTACVCVCAVFVPQPFSAFSVDVPAHGFFLGRKEYYLENFLQPFPLIRYCGGGSSLRASWLAGRAGDRCRKDFCRRLKVFCECFSWKTVNSFKGHFGARNFCRYNKASMSGCCCYLSIVDTTVAFVI